jgi:toluene monooxygenase system protein E
VAPSKRRTWSAFGDIKRRPSEYEIVTHALHYNMRAGRAAPYESNPSAPMNMWVTAYRDESPFQAENWDGFRDPDQMIYREYVTKQDEKEVVMRDLCSEFADRGHDGEMDPKWVDTLRTVFTPARYPLHGMQMMAAYLGLVAPSSYITNAAAFEAADYVRAVSVVAYRTRELQMAHPEKGFVDGERQIWETHEAWQPTRKVIEEALVAYDWAECFTALNLVLRPTIEAVLYKTFSRVASANGDELTSLLLANLSDDGARAARWSAALATYAIGQNAQTADVLNMWVEKWSPGADAAASGIASLLGSLPAKQGDAKEAAQAARGARMAVLEQAGLMAGAAS